MDFARASAGKLLANHARGQSGQLLRFAREAGLIGIASVSREIGGSVKTRRASELEKPLKAKDTVQRLRTVTERFVAAPPERAH